jgi:hypothetical protein
LDQIPGAIAMSETITNAEFFTLGFEMTLQGSATTNVFSSDLDTVPPGTALFNADVSGSLHWGGIDFVTDLAGNLIPRDQWTIQSASGFDYSQPFSVPEPSSIVLLVIALCCGAGAGTKRALKGRARKRDTLMESLPQVGATTCMMD